MSFVVTPLSSSTAGGDVPRIGYDNLFREGTITLSGETVGYEASLAYDWLTNTAWQADSAGQAWIQFDAGAGNTRRADYLACYAPDLAENGGTIKLQWSDNGSTWTDATSALAPTSDRPIVSEFFSVLEKRYWRILVDSTPTSLIPVVAAGESLLFDQGLKDGYAPPLLSRDVDITNYESTGGTFVNRIVRRRGCTQNIQCQNNSETWTRDNWLPFIKHAELLPFFWFWRPTASPAESALLHAERMGAASYNAVGFHRLSLRARGVCNDL